MTTHCSTPPGSGSGHGTGRADAIAALCVALLSRDGASTQVALARLDQEHRDGRSPLDGAALQRRLEVPLRSAFPAVVRAGVPTETGAGDFEVVVPASAGRPPVVHRVELKAQLEKDKASDLTQADWVRDHTDALRWLVAHDPAVTRLLPAGIRRELTAPPADLADWDFGHLWLADVAGLTSRETRARLGVPKPAALGPYLARKHLLHLYRRGTDLRPLSSLLPISRALADPGQVRYEVRQNRASLCAVRILVGRHTQFTYHLYDAEGKFLGRHKLHGRVLAVA